MEESLKQKTISGVSWSFAENVLVRGTNFIIGIVIARILSPTEYGLIGLLGVFLAISQLFIDGGLTTALIRTKNPSEKDFSTVYLINILLSVFFYFLLFFCAPVIADYYDQPLLRPLIRVLSLTLVIASIASIQGTILTIRVDFRTKTLISISASLISGLTGLLCAYKGWGVWALVAQSVISTTVISVLSLILVHWFPKLRFSKASFQKLFSFGSKKLLASFISIAYENTYNLVIGKRFGVRDVGLFSRANQFPGVINQTLINSFNRVAFPILSRIQDEDQRLISIYERYIQAFCFLAFPILMGLCGCARPIISLLLKDRWLDCAPYMQLICLSLLPNGIIIINLNLLYVKGRSDLLLRMEVIKKMIMFAVMFVAMFFGMKALCLSLILNGWIDLYFSSYYTKKILGYRLSQQLKAVFPYFLLSLFVLALSSFFTVLIHKELVSVLVSIIVCPIAYFFLARMMKLYVYREAVSLLREKIVKH